MTFLSFILPVLILAAIALFALLYRCKTTESELIVRLYLGNQLVQKQSCSCEFITRNGVASVESVVVKAEKNLSFDNVAYSIPSLPDVVSEHKYVGLFTISSGDTITLVPDNDRNVIFTVS